MNKKDIFLIIIVLLISGLLYLIFNLTENKNVNKAIVYHENDKILEIDLNSNKIYEVNGDNGIVKIEASNGKIKVLEENSPYHICSRQGYISKSYEVIICMPNKIVIKIENSSEIDTIAR